MNTSDWRTRATQPLRGCRFVRALIASHSSSSSGGSGTDFERFIAMLWDLYQHFQLRELDARVDHLQDEASRVTIAHDATKHLAEKVERLALITRALFELLEESTGVSEEQLRAKITEIDLRDGQADGRMSPRPTRCPKCDAMMSPRFGRCLFCGEQDKSAPGF